MALFITASICVGFYLLTRKALDYSDQSPTFEEAEKEIQKNKRNGN